jgi:hypothetical protein
MNLAQSPAAAWLAAASASAADETVVEARAELRAPADAAHALPRHEHAARPGS